MKGDLKIDNGRYKEWKQLQTVIDINLDDIIITSKSQRCSFEAMQDSYYIDKVTNRLRNIGIDKLNEPIVIREIKGNDKNDGLNSNKQYSLVAGVRGLTLANKLGHKTIPCIITKVSGWNRFVFMIKNMPLECDGMMNINRINIPIAFAKTPPNKDKIVLYTKYYKEHGRLDKAITIDKSGMLVDGYARYVVAKMNEFNTVPIKYEI